MVLSARAPRKKGAASLREALQDLESGACETLAIRAIARRWKWSPGRTHRHLTTLKDNGWLIQTATGYRLADREDENRDFWLQWAVERDETMFGGEPTRYIPASLRKQVFQRDQNKCVVCGSTHLLEVDHIIPFSRRGRHRLGNLRLLCKSCNLAKRDKTDCEWKPNPHGG